MRYPVLRNKSFAERLIYKITTSSQMVTVQARTVGALILKRPSIREGLALEITSLSIKLFNLKHPNA